MATTRQTPPKSGARKDGTDAIALLLADHEEVKQLFKQYEALVKAGGEGEEKQTLAEQICWSLTVHATIEEEVFYPAARDCLEEQDLLDEAQVEHDSARDLIAQIADMDPGEELFDAKVKVLGEYVSHHVREEEDELFPKLKRSTLDLATLGEELAVRKQQILAEAGAEQDG